VLLKSSAKAVFCGAKIQIHDCCPALIKTFNFIALTIGYVAAAFYLDAWCIEKLKSKT
jgi:hypothetical protein